MSYEKNKKYKYLKRKRCDYLKDILKRLDDDVITCMDLIKNFNQETGKNIGFWVSVRIIMPVIETVANTLKTKPENVLKEIGIETPFLVWDMFRNSLLHGDQINSAQYSGNKIIWGISIENFECLSRKGLIHFDADDILIKLKSFIISEIKKNDETIINIPVTIEYTNPSQKIIDEFEIAS